MVFQKSFRLGCTYSTKGVSEQDFPILNMTAMPAVTNSPAVPLGLSAFSIWGNGVSAGQNGFLGGSLQSAPRPAQKSEKDLAHAREAGYFCPLTKAVIADPVVASDG